LHRRVACRTVAPEMKAAALLVAYRLALLVAVTASAMLVVEYQNVGDPAFCGVGSACFTVRISPYSSVMGVPLPNVGLVAFAGLMALSLLGARPRPAEGDSPTPSELRRARSYRLFGASLSVVGAVGGVVLLLLQKYKVQVFCPFCVAVDLSAIVAGVLALVSLRVSPATEEAIAREPAALGSGGESVRWGIASVAAAALPFVWGLYPVLPEAPRAISELGVPGKVTVVQFTDFECPFCRALHPQLEAMKKAYEGRIHYVRVMAPLDSHPGAKPAARLYLCAPEDQREVVADRLYRAEPGHFDEAGLAAVAEAAGLDAEKTRACLASSAPDEPLARDRARYEAAGAKGLPLTYVGPRVVLGAVPDRIARALAAELGGQRSELPVSWLYAALGALGALVSGWLLRDVSREA
jgi:protein-disulfide isomerase